MSALAPEIRGSIAEARRTCGAMIAVTVEALGYTIVPTPLIEAFIRQVERDDAARAAQVAGSKVRR